jgi:hypothetical protein
MKLLLVLVSCLLPCNSALSEQSGIWAGTCLNHTTGQEGFLKVALGEPGLDVGSKNEVAGYMCVTGWLAGGGEFIGRIAGDTLTFTTHDFAVINWTGQQGGDVIAGTYKAPQNGVSPAQVGAFRLKKLPSKVGSEAEFRQLFMLLLEWDFNCPVVLADGKTVLKQQLLFDSVHPVGTATSVRITDTQIEWQEDAEKKRTLEEIRRYTVDLTIYWSGPIQEKGWTKMRLSYNAELEELTAQTVVDTNGVTKEKAGKLAIDIGLMFAAAATKVLLESE